MTPTRSSREPVFASTHRAHGIQVLSDSWRYLFVDELAARQMHKQVDDLLGRTLQECHPGVTGTQVFAALVQCRRERTPTTVSHEFLSTDGDGRELLLQILPMSTGVCVLSTDETANRQPAAQTIAAAEEIEHYLNMILDAAIGGITSAVSPGATDLCAELQTIAALSRAAAARVGELKRLAAGAPAPEPVPEPVPEPATPPPGAGPLRVLVVEDTREVADILVRLLQANGHETLLAHDAAAAQRLWSDHAQQIDLVVTDLRLPDGSGLDLIRDLRRARPDLPGLCVSGAPCPERLDHRVRFLEKPFMLHELRAEVDALTR